MLNRVANFFKRPETTKGDLVSMIQELKSRRAQLAREADEADAAGRSLRAARLLGDRVDEGAIRAHSVAASEAREEIAAVDLALGDAQAALNEICGRELEARRAALAAAQDATATADAQLQREFAEHIAAAGRTLAAGGATRLLTCTNAETWLSEFTEVLLLLKMGQTTPADCVQLNLPAILAAVASALTAEVREVAAARATAIKAREKEAGVLVLLTPEKLAKAALSAAETDPSQAGQAA